LNEVKKIVENGGKCLLPVLASGRGEELLLIMEEEWKRNNNIQNIKIHYTAELFHRFKTIFKFFIHLTPSRN
jgi:cleavage and polyadenylation specificity factor subunit 3